MKRLVLLFLLCLGCTSAAAAPKAYTPVALNVLAVSSLAAPMRDIATLYAQKHNVSVIFIFDSPVALAARIENGEAADVFITDNAKLLEGLKQKGLLDTYSVHAIGENRLVLAFPRTGMMLSKLPPKLGSKGAVEWLSSRSLFVLGDAETTALGEYTEQALRNTGNWNKVKDRVIKAQSNQQAAFLTVENKAAGILYESDVIAMPALERIATFKPESHEPITYSTSAVAGENMKEARKFIAFLESAQAGAVLERYGITR